LGLSSFFVLGLNQMRKTRYRFNFGLLPWGKLGDSAEVGDYTSGPKVIAEETKKAMRELLKAVQNGEWARQWILENKAGRPMFTAMRRQWAEHPIEQVGERLRAMMSWITKDRAVDREKN
jgi:ketol-acid reductoisomerase